MSGCHRSENGEILSGHWNDKEVSGCHWCGEKE